MQILYSLCYWLGNTLLGKSIHDSTWMFPVIETVHLFGVVILVGFASVLDLRLMGMAFKDFTVSMLAKRFLPWIWAGFVIQLVTGFLLFASEAAKMYGNDVFRAKMLMIVAAGINALVFHLIAYRSVGRWERDPVAPWSARFAGAFSILLWFGIVGAGRWIAYS
ncbi:MAG TPA: DUF6644 family protein [Candidatus Dormibacteraeota bacterium]|nr:DUF6644 family protein [Candidatus Dormibacteraeota bacterium]